MTGKFDVWRINRPLLSRPNKKEGTIASDSTEKFGLRDIRKKKFGSENKAETSVEKPTKRLNKVTPPFVNICKY